MNTHKISQALNTISLGLGELAEALNESPSPARLGGQGPGSAHPAPASTFSDGLPVEEPPVWADEPEAGPYKPLQPTAQDQLLGECPVHFKPWTVKEGGISKNGKPYSAFWRCGEKDANGYCSKKPDKQWVRSHDPERALAAA